MGDDGRYHFLVEWFDNANKVKREFVLTYYSADGTLEMYDRQLKRMFLKRIFCENISLKDLHLGSMLNVLSRQLLITGYADDKTEKAFAKTSEPSLLIIKHNGLKKMGTIIDILYSNGLIITKGRLIKADRSNNPYVQSSFLKDLEHYFAVFEVRGENVMNILMKILGMETMAPVSTNIDLGYLNQECLTPKTEMMCKYELEIFFPSHKEIFCNTMVTGNSTACIIKPHAVRDGKAGKIIQNIIDAEFNISALHFLNFDIDTSSEFYEVYKGVLSFYHDMVSQLVSGPSIALQITKESTGDIVQSFRQLVGPINSIIAKKLHPNSLRALYGEDNVKNAIHCTDLSEDGKLEIEYLFYLMPMI